jgi:predicted DNA-binding WGR domain protein
MEKTCFKFIGGTSAKFWNVEVEGSEYTVHYGRIGSLGRKLTKDLGSNWEAIKKASKKIEEKIGKGYGKVSCD